MTSSVDTKRKAVEEIIKRLMEVGINAGSLVLIFDEGDKQHMFQPVLIAKELIHMQMIRGALAEGVLMLDRLIREKEKNG